MAYLPSHIRVKGSRDGLTFYFDGNVAMEVWLAELQQLLQREHHLFQGPAVPVRICFGRVPLGTEEAAIRACFASHPNLIVHRVEASSTSITSRTGEKERTAPTLLWGPVRSGAEIQSDGALIVAGDVHSGARLVAKGTILVFGILRGMACAGSDGDIEAIIAAWELACPVVEIASRRKSFEKLSAGPTLVRLEGEELVTAPARHLKRGQGGREQPWAKWWS
ncbi:MAG: hypothetical protein IMW91_06860 [Firmicutes bacterium]|nr:hypothetical protein [Bacillota bacterium]